jgi:Domain of unknown function (DUF4266)
MKLRFLLPAAALLLCSCSEKLCRVKQFERGHLAKPVMSSEHFALHAAMTEHTYFSREGSFGGGGVGGGGCGCN